MTDPARLLREWNELGSKTVPVIARVCRGAGVHDNGHAIKHIEAETTLCAGRLPASIGVWISHYSLFTI